MDIPVRRHVALAFAAVAVVGLLLLVFAGPAIGRHTDPAPAGVADTYQVNTDAPSVNLTPNDPGVMLTSPAVTSAPAGSAVSVQGPTGTPGAAQADSVALLAEDPAPEPNPNPQPTPQPTVEPTVVPTGEGQPNGPNGELAPTTPPPPPNPAEAVNPTINPTP